MLGQNVFMKEDFCVDLTVQQKEADTKQINLALAQASCSALTAEVCLVASHYQYWQCSLYKATAQLHGKSATRHITEATTSSIFIQFQ